MIYGDFVAYLYPISQDYRHVNGSRRPCADSHLENITQAMLTERTASAFGPCVPPLTGTDSTRFRSWASTYPTPRHSLRDSLDVVVTGDRDIAVPQ